MTPAVRPLARFALAAVLLAGCKHGKVTTTECGSMLDKYVEMKVAADPQLAALPPAQASIARDMKREVAKADKSYRQVEEQCEREVTRGEYDCAMKSPSPNDWEACIE